MRFPTTVVAGTGNATGLAVPEEVLDSLDAGRRPAVRVTLNGHSYRSTVGRRDGQFLVPLSAEHRAAAGVVAGDAVDVHLELDAAPRDVAVPDDLAEALGPLAEARAFFDGLAPGQRKEWVRWIEEAKKPETRAKRLTATVEAMIEGRKTR